jgi:hypothetical protein
MDQFGLGVFVNIDPYAATLQTDRLTVQNWLDHYIRVDGTAFETDTYVGEFLPNVPKLPLEYTHLQAALEKLAALVTQNLQFWADPDLFFHWAIIPPWQDVAQQLMALNADPSSSLMPSMFPEPIGLDQLGTAPKNIVDTITDAATQVALVRLSFDFDGSSMPEQLYVKGGTGYTYNAPALADDNKTVVSEPVAGEAQYQLTFVAANTKVWVVDATGYISVTYSLVGPSGPYKVEWCYIPWNETRHKGGHFWRLLEGPDAGKYVDNDTNILSGYGEILVEATTPGLPGDPQIGIGGSGWVGEIVQDPNKRQAYLEAPISIDRNLRDSLGGQVIYRSAQPTLRGGVFLREVDGWRVGQLVKITDVRLPASLNEMYFLIQRVRATLIPNNDIREYDLDWGDGPTSRYSYQPMPGSGDLSWPSPATQIEIDARDLAPGPNATQIITGQLINAAGEPWRIEGKVVEWTLEVRNNLGQIITGQGSLAPSVSITDSSGKARTVLTTGATTNLVYYVFADVVAT